MLGRALVVRVLLAQAQAAKVRVKPGRSPYASVAPDVQLARANRHRTRSTTLDIEPPGDRTGSGFTGQLAIKVY